MPLLLSLELMIVWLLRLSRTRIAVPIPPAAAGPATTMLPVPSGVAAAPIIAELGVFVIILVAAIHAIIQDAVARQLRYTVKGQVVAVSAAAGITAATGAAAVGVLV